MLYRPVKMSHCFPSLTFSPLLLSEVFKELTLTYIYLLISTNLMH